MNSTVDKKQRVDGAIDDLMSALRESVSADCVAVNIFINSEGAEVTYRHRSAEHLAQAGIAMRNISGKWVR